MNRRPKLTLLLLASLVMAAAYLGGALAPPLLRAAAAGDPGGALLGAALVPAQLPPNAYVALQSATDLLLSGDDSTDLYLPMIRRQ